MIAPVVLATLIAIVPAPSVLPTQPPVIYRTVTSETCTTLRTLSLPIGTNTKKNNASFRAMAQSLDTFLKYVLANDSPVADNDQLLYGPKQLLSVAQVESVAQQIYANLTVEDRDMAQSWKDYPAGSDPKVDAMRQRAQNLMDLQRALADHYEKFAGTYLENRGPAVPNVDDPASFRALMLAEASELSGNPAYKRVYEPKDISTMAQLGNVSQIEQTFGEQEQAFATEIISTYNQCEGTHFFLNTPSPGPAPL